MFRLCTILCKQAHFSEQINLYGPQTVITLVNHHSREELVGAVVRDSIALANNPVIKFFAFEFHAETKHMQWERLSLLMDRIESERRRHQFFIRPLEGKKITENEIQHGIFRTSCMDCLDRTNVIQVNCWLHNCR